MPLFLKNREAQSEDDPFASCSNSASNWKVCSRFLERYIKRKQLKLQVYIKIYQSGLWTEYMFDFKCANGAISAFFSKFYFFLSLCFFLCVLQWTVEHTLFPAFKRHLRPPRELLDGAIIPIADLPDLYKVFERCWKIVLCMFSMVRKVMSRL